MTNHFTSAVLDAAVPGAELRYAEVFGEGAEVFGAETEGDAAANFVGIVRGVRRVGVGHEWQRSAGRGRSANVCAMGFAPAVSPDVFVVVQSGWKWGRVAE